MSISNTPFDQIGEADLQRLIENRVPESRNLEFKREQYGRNDEAKREWLKDVSALANTSGGDLIIGIGEKDGVAATLKGIMAPPPDDEIRRLEQILQDGLEPRLIGTSLRAIDLAAGGYAILVRVQGSWNAPHRVVYQRSNRFFGRNAGGAFELGVEQLRAAFLGGAEAEQQLTNFRLERLARLKSGTSIPLMGPGKLVLHIAPLLSSIAAIDIADALKPDMGFRPMGDSGWRTTSNFDGVLLAEGPPDRADPRTSFVQVFRNGRLEAGLGLMVFNLEQRGYPRVLAYARGVPMLLRALPRYVAGLVRLGISPPLLVMTSLLDVAGSVMLDERSWQFENAQQLDRDDLLFAPIVIENVEFTEGWQTIMRPVFESWWNAYGLQRCYHLFNDAGEWTGYPPNWRV